MQFNLDDDHKHKWLIKDYILLLASQGPESEQAKKIWISLDKQNKRKIYPKKKNKREFIEDSGEEANYSSKNGKSKKAKLEDEDDD